MVAGCWQIWHVAITSKVTKETYQSILTPFNCPRCLCDICVEETPTSNQTGVSSSEDRLPGGQYREGAGRKLVT